MQVTSREMVYQLEQAEVHSLKSRLKAIQGISGNPMNVSIQEFGEATAFTAKMIPGPSFNTVKGLRVCDEKNITAIIDYFEERKIPCRFEITPTAASQELFAYLAAKGFYQADFHTLLYGAVNQSATVSHKDLFVRELKGNEFDVFADIYVRGFGMPGFLKEGVAQNNKILYESPNWRFYLVSVNGENVGIGVLFTDGKFVDLAAAATLPNFRNLGIQTALIQTRIAEAAKLQCKWVFGQARFGSVSQKNMERAGMQIAYTKAIWVDQ